jgi:hypothetical protein
MKKLAAFVLVTLVGCSAGTTTPKSPSVVFPGGPGGGTPSGAHPSAGLGSPSAQVR